MSYYAFYFHVQDNFLLRNGFSNETCILIHWKNSIQEFMGVGSKIWLQVQINDPEIGSHALAEGSQLTVPAPRRIQIFCRSAYDPHFLCQNAITLSK